VFLKSAGRGWRANGRYGRLVARPPFAGESLHDAILREKEPVDHLKVVNSGLASLKEFGKEGSPQFDSDQLKEAARFAERSGLKVMVHANGREPVKQSIDAGCHSIEHGFFMGKENIFKMADTRITWVPTAFTMKAYAENPSFPVRERDIAMKNYEHQLNQVSIAARSGVAIAVGTDSGSQGVNHGTAMRDEIRALMDGGLSIEMAMKCATVNGSVLLGLTDHPGGLTKGSPANFVALKGDISRLPDSLSDPIAIYMRGKKVFPPSP
jgi:imidazolonepropionase-like amidohydrolase